ncbi:MAG: NADH-quinone oxidoreductase subunit J [Thermoprotei archaeon]
MAYYIIVALTLLSVVGFTVTRDIVRAVGLLLVILTLVAALFALMDSLLLAMIQLMVYAGAVIVIFLFGVMLTRRETPTSRIRQLASAENLLYLVFALLLFLLILRAAIGFAQPLGYVFINPQLVALSLYIQLRGVVYALAALIAASSLGAIYVVRRERKHEEGGQNMGVVNR